MKNIIQKVMKACNPNSTQVTGGMMKMQNNNLIAYGGTFCIQAPITISIECVFNPNTLLAFHRKDRTGASYTVKDDRLTMKHRREKVVMRCLPAREMPIIDVFSDKRVSKGISDKLAKTLVKCIDPSHHIPSMQGVLIRDGHIIATDSKILLVVKAKSFAGIEVVIPNDTIKVIASLGGKMTHFSIDDNCIKFFYEDGMTLTSRLLNCEGYPEVLSIFDGGDYTEIDLGDQVMNDLKEVDSDFIKVNEDHIKYATGVGRSRDVGEIEIKVSKSFNFFANKKYLDILLEINRSNKIYLKKGVIKGDGGKFFQCAMAEMKEVSDGSI